MKERILNYLRDNLRDPGTMRSLAWAFVGLAMASNSEEAVAHYASVAVFLLGIVSAAIPPRKP
jgi:hypothetical protein